MVTAFIPTPMDGPPRPDGKRRVLARSISRGALHPWLFPLLWCTTLAAGIVLWKAYAWSPALIVSFLTALSGLETSLVKLHVQLEKREFAKAASVSGRERTLAPLVVVSLFCGIIIGYLLLPLLVDALLEPAGEVKILSVVEATQPATVRWRNLASDQDVRVLVRQEGNHADLVEPCVGHGSRGFMSCELVIGGEQAAGVFEIRVVSVPRTVSEHLGASPPEGLYLSPWPNGIQVLTTKTVTRK